MATLITNTMRYGWDSFSFRKQAMIKSSKSISAVGITNVEGFDIQGYQSGDSGRYAEFLVDGQCYKLSIASDGTATPVLVDTQSPSIDSVMNEGNTAADLMSVKNIPAWIGKNIYPILVLDAAPDVTKFPTFKLGIKLRSNQDRFIATEESSEYDTSKPSDSKIIDISCNVTKTGSATAICEVSLFQNNNWTDYMSIDNAKGQIATKVKCRLTYTVTTASGADSVQVNNVNINYSSNGSNIVASDETSEIYTTTQNYNNNLHYCQTLIKHKKLNDAKIKAYVSFRVAPKFKSLNLGIGTGEVMTFVLGDMNADGKTRTPDPYIDHNTLIVKSDGKIIDNFNFNTRTSSVQLTPDKGAVITASYNYWPVGSRTDIAIGTGTDTDNQKVTLGSTDANNTFVVDKYINKSSLVIKIGGVKLDEFNSVSVLDYAGRKIDEKKVPNYTIDLKTGEVTFCNHVTKGAAITASYDYGWNTEEWNEMQLESCEPYDSDKNIYSSRYTFSLPDNYETIITSVKFELCRPKNTVKKQNLGTGTGNKQIFVLDHSSISDILCDGLTDTSWSYDDNTHLFTVSAENGQDILINYDWVAETPEIYAFTVGWAE